MSFTKQELEIIFQALSSVSVQGQFARQLADLRDKVEAAVKDIKTDEKNESES